MFLVYRSARIQSLIKFQMEYFGTDEEEEEQDFDATVDENDFFASSYRKYDGPEAFLHRSETMFVRGTTLTSAALSVWLEYNTDVDGCVVELKRISGFLKPVGHITICPSGRASLKGAKSQLRKHVDLNRYNSSELSNFNKCVAIQLFYEGGWDCRLALIPVHTRGSVSFSQEVISQMAYKVFLQLRARFQKAFHDYAKRGIATRTLAKNDLNNAGKIFILPDDRTSIIDALDGALNDLELGTGHFRPIVYCFRFGEKMRSGIKMTAFDRDMIEKVTVHAAVDISSSIDGIHLMWSMSGLQKVTGDRGTLSTCMSFSDCGNFQSNIDGRPMDIRPELKRICRNPNSVTFVQLYADIPHRMPKSRFHPISGLIGGGMCFAKPTVDAFCRDSETYLSALESNWTLFQTSTCRVEVVSIVNVQSDIIDAIDVIDLVQLGSLLETKPMLAPFTNDALVCIRELGLWITIELKGLLRKFQRTGNVKATWKAFQLELASEKLLWGRPLCHMSDRYSVNIGPGLLASSRSLTDDLGFLALDAWSACVADEDSIPLYTIWTRSEAIGRCMIRAAGLHDYIDSSYPVIGRRLVLALLKDLFEIGKVGTFFRFGECFMEMKAEKTRFATVGSVTTQSLCRTLSANRRMSLHMVFGSLRQLLEKANLPLDEVLDAGLKELKLTHFPAFQTYDRQGNATLSWSLRSNFWSLVVDPESVGEGSRIVPDVYYALVKGELERRQLIFPSKLKKIAFTFPWIVCCLRKLKSEKLDTDRTVTTLAFISCVALIMEGWFVDFDRLSLLASELPVSQGRLKILEIQSKLLLPFMNSKDLVLYRLHQSIPHKLQKIEAGPLTSKTEEPTPQTANHFEGRVTVTAPRIGEDEDDVSVSEQVCTVYRRTVCKPIEISRSTWNRDELEILNKVAEMRNVQTVRELYDAFRDECVQKGIAFRTLNAFRFKLKRV